MTTMNNADILDLSNSENMGARESLWSRIVGKFGGIFGRMWAYMNEDMGPTNHSGDYFTLSDCCS